MEGQIVEVLVVEGNEVPAVFQHKEEEHGELGSVRAFAVHGKRLSLTG